ncbi:hypothetical protein HDU97_001719 [Phlyctochytrium planicorne]|nr:hypothetical protein HDU97_001719 [Phlyctochytrium planicorne]
MQVTDDDDVPQLSADTLAILQSFLIQKEEAEEKFEKLRAAAHEEADEAAERAKRELDVQDFGEDWQWYDDATATRLAKEALDATPDGGRIGCVSSPSVFIKLMKMDLASRNIQAHVLEFDKRFQVYGPSHFIFFDFNLPPTHINDSLPSSLPTFQNAFDTLVVDPPFLSDECWSATANAVGWLRKEGARVLVCTGMMMAGKVCEEVGVRKVRFEVVHQGERLSNEFGCFANFEVKGGDGAFEWV